MVIHELGLFGLTLYDTVVVAEVIVIITKSLHSSEIIATVVVIKLTLMLHSLHWNTVSQHEHYLISVSKMTEGKN